MVSALVESVWHAALNVVPGVHFHAAGNVEIFQGLGACRKVGGVGAASPVCVDAARACIRIAARSALARVSGCSRLSAAMRCAIANFSCGVMAISEKGRFVMLL